jgi:hypothetical protein
MGQDFMARIRDLPQLSDFLCDRAGWQCRDQNVPDVFIEGCELTL